MDASSKILSEAKRLLEDELQWTQGVLTVFDYNKEKFLAACALGSIAIASINLGTSIVYKDQTDAQDRLKNIVGSSIVDFNDDPNTTKEDVLIAFKRAIYETGEE